jgi:hypothetical protein
MKKFLFLIFFFMGSLSALYIGNPVTPAIIYEGIIISDLIPVSARLGFLGNFLLEKKFTFPNTAFKNSSIEGDFYLAQTTLNFFDRLDLSVSGGLSKVEFSSNFMSSDIKEKSDFGYALRAGAKLIIFHVKSVSLAFDGNYFLAKAKKAAFLDLNNNAWFRLQQWQASFSLSTELGYFSPYLGGVFNSSRFKINQINSFTINGVEKENLGVFMGLTFTTHSYFLINLEGQFYSETSFAINAELRF